MDSNEKRMKRPRIGENRQAQIDNASSFTEKTTQKYTTEEGENPERREYNGGYRQNNGYNNRPRQNGGYNNHNNYRQNNYNRSEGYNRQDGYNSYNRNYNNGGNHSDYQSENQGENNFSESTQNNRSYPQRNNYNRQGGYNNNRPRQNSNYGNRNYNNGGSYGNRDRQNNYGGGYNNRYNQNNNFGGNRGRQGGYNNNHRQRPNEYGMPQGGKSFVPRPKPVIYEQEIPDPNQQIRLNKFLANAGICSRREADEQIQQGMVKVNGVVVTELGSKISHADTVEYNGKIVTPERKCYILLNKPKDCVTTSDDPGERLTVMDLVKNACEERIYPVGRLDRNTTGVLLLTNDGDLASKLTHPKYVKKKIYHVWTDKDISEDDMQRIADGIELEDGPIHADAISYATDTDRNQAGIEIHSGRNRIVRRIFESLGYHVTKLDRVYFAGLTKKNLPRGRWRYLTQEEVNFLKMGSFE